MGPQRIQDGLSYTRFIRGFLCEREQAENWDRAGIAIRLPYKLTRKEKKILTVI